MYRGGAHPLRRRVLAVDQAFGSILLGTCTLSGTLKMTPAIAANVAGRAVDPGGRERAGRINHLRYLPKSCACLARRKMLSAMGQARYWRKQTELDEE